MGGFYLFAPQTQNHHEQGKTTYVEMSKKLADSDIEKWTFDTKEMTMAYFDSKGVKVLEENIE